MKTVKPLSVFLDCAVGIEAVQDALANIVGHSFHKNESDVGVRCSTRALCIEWRLFRDHGLEDDCGIEFSEYDYQLQLVPLQQGQELAEFDSMYEGVTSFVASKLSRALECRSLVVANLQRKVAAFGPGGH